MTYKFSCCEVCKKRRLECKGSENMCAHCRRDKKVPKVWSGKNNMDPMCIPEELSEMPDAEQMLIARLAPTVHVHMLQHEGIASRGHCIAFPQAVQEPATVLPRLPREVDIIRVRRQGKDEARRLQNLPADGELPNLRTVEFCESADNMQQLDASEIDSTDDSTVSGIILPEPE